jgi:flagellar biosynthesis protein FliQ
MTFEEAIFLGQHALYTVAAVSGPILVITMVVGIVVSLFQAVTQLQEMTIVFVPKILAVFLLVGILGGWMLQEIVDYGRFCFASIEDVAK